MDRIIWALKAKENWVLFPGVGKALNALLPRTVGLMAAKAMSGKMLSLWMGQILQIRKLKNSEAADTGKLQKRISVSHRARSTWFEMAYPTKLLSKTSVSSCAQWSWLKCSWVCSPPPSPACQAGCSPSRWFPIAVRSPIIPRGPHVHGAFSAQGPRTYSEASCRE